MKGLFKDLTSDKTIFRFNIFTILIIVFTIIFITISYRRLPPIIPLFNQLPWGSQRLGSTFSIFIPSIIVIMIFIINMFIAKIVYKKTPLVSRMLAVTSFLIAFLT